jgi:hypothetical protein
MKGIRIAGLTVAAGLLVAAVTGASTSCSQTPTNIPVRTFQQAQRMDYVCMAVNDQNGNPLPGNDLKPLLPDDCSPLPANVGGFVPNHLFALVTQTTPGTLAVVDLTNGNVVDEDKSTPGVNFIPVGARPTDVAAAPDGAMSFVTSGDVNKPALYGLDTRRILGDSGGSPPLPPLQLTDLPACALPQPPSAVIAAPTSGGNYVLLVILRAWAGLDAQIATIDPKPLLRGAHLAGGAGPVDAPGTLSPCTALSATTLASTTPKTFTGGPTWPDGVPYVDGGVDLDGAEPPPVPALPEGGTAAACPAGGRVPPGASVPLSVGPLQPPDPTAMALRTDKQLLYVADSAVPLIHVIDVSNPSKLTEDPSKDLLAISSRDPGKRVPVGPLAISPPTRDYKRYLYAVDESDGTVMVFDITDPNSSSRTPLQRPHAELNPFYPIDRLSFSSPVATVAFVQHDWVLPSQVDPTHYYSGLLCNPNPAAHPNANSFRAKGAYYRADQAAAIESSGTVENFPGRLRGVFGFVTLSTGSVVPIDVDDWDAPCRRPDPMTDQPVHDFEDAGYTDPGSNGAPLWHGRTGLLDIPQPYWTGPNDFDEYHAPLTYQSSISDYPAVTLEAFFPVSSPHRIRSNFLLLNDPNTGNHSPNVPSQPQLFDQNGAPVQLGSPTASLLQPTQLAPGFIDPSQVQNPSEPNPTLRTQVPNAPDAGGQASGATANIRVSFDDPTTHFDQDWTLTFEGVLPGTPGVTADIVSTDDYQSLILTTGTSVPPADAGATGLTTPGFCALGIEDWTVGIARRDGMGDKAQAAAGAWTADYIEFADDLLQQGDGYWGLQGNECWAGTSLADGSSSDVSDARYSACSQTFGSSGTATGTSGYGTVADTYPSRDFPIIRAYDDHLQIGRFGWVAKNEDPSSRVVVGPNSSPDQASFLKFAQCCFHRQATFKVRTGGEWSLVGQNGLGLLHHVRGGPGGACVLSCDPADTLLNGRLLDTSVASGGKANCPTVVAPPSSTAAPLRNDPSALRNPMFSFYIVPPPKGAAPDCNHTLITRDVQWRFSMRGGFDPIAISLTQGSAGGVSPQSMRFVEPFGQLAVVDGAQQGLVLIDLNTLGFAHSPYF